MDGRLDIAIVGAGIGGLAAAGMLCKAGFTNLRVYEQAGCFARVGAGIEVTPNAMKALRGIGLDTTHGVDLCAALRSILPPGMIRLDRKLVALGQAGGEVTLAFADGTRETAHLVIGADGARSTVREVMFGPLPERAPLERWSDGRIVLLGDACHPMSQDTAQGAAISIEDAAVLARCLAELAGEDVEGALRRYEAHRKPRASRIQAIASANTGLQKAEGDTAWLYGYDACTANLDEPATS